ncbi:hypothetical protein [Synechococcus sp. KORDI-100]|nr:hypothetical protein [Synechococcus sp. KORDI-100]
MSVGRRRVDEMVWAGVIFAIGAAVTLATAAMILSGHQRHRRSHRREVG